MFPLSALKFKKSISHRWLNKFASLNRLQQLHFTTHSSFIRLTRPTRHSFRNTSFACSSSHSFRNTSLVRLHSYNFVHSIFELHSQSTPPALAVVVPCELRSRFHSLVVLIRSLISYASLIRVQNYAHFVCSTHLLVVLIRSFIRMFRFICCFRLFRFAALLVWSSISN